MEFRASLAFVALAEVVFGEWFDSRMYANFTGLPVKLASNELRRLYKMDFLERRGLSGLLRLEAVRYVSEALCTNIVLVSRVKVI